MGIHYSRRRLTLCALLALLLTDVSAAAGFNLLSQNMNRLFDDIDDGNKAQQLSPPRFQKRVAMAVEKFGTGFSLPQVIALQEVENRHVVEQIAAGLAQQYSTRYRTLLVPGHDISSINLAWLVREDVSIRRFESLFHRE